MEACRIVVEKHRNIVRTGQAVWSQANAETARRVIVDVIPRIPPEPNWPEHFALDTALVTDRKLWPQATVEKLKPILARFLVE